MIKKIFPELLLALAALILLAGLLGPHAIWTQEYRWQQVCLHMLATKDYWHPYLDGKPYYDKPLLTYWLIVVLAKLNHGVLTNTLLRLPSVFAGFITLSCTYSLAKFYADRKTALLAAWLLLTTFYFVFWARVASADMWNLAAILLAIVWYLKIESQRIFWRDFIFFLLLVFGALLKGLIAPALVFVVLLPRLRFSWKSFLNPGSIIAACLALVLYLLPFEISSMNAHAYSESGLVEVFRENILRFFAPFDHEGPWWTYFLYAPIYSLPWFLLLPMLVRVSRQGIQFSTTQLWPVLSIFIFLSLSGSRRSYYILPILPFVMIWLSAAWQQRYGANLKYCRRLYGSIAFIYVVLFANFLILQPYYYLHQT